MHRRGGFFCEKSAARPRKRPRRGRRVQFECLELFPFSSLFTGYCTDMFTSLDTSSPEQR
jgi:hypothetical protein